MKYIQHNLHYRPVKPGQGIPNDQEKNFLQQDNYRSGSNFPLNVLQDDYEDMLSINVQPHHLFFPGHNLSIPGEYLVQFLLQAHKIYYHASQRQYSKTMEAPVHLFLIHKRQDKNQYVQAE